MNKEIKLKFCANRECTYYSVFPHHSIEEGCPFCKNAVFIDMSLNELKKINHLHPLLYIQNMFNRDTAHNIRLIQTEGTGKTTGFVRKEKQKKKLSNEIRKDLGLLVGICMLLFIGYCFKTRNLFEATVTLFVFIGYMVCFVLGGKHLGWFNK